MANESERESERRELQEKAIAKIERRRPLKVEADLSGDDALEHLLAALRRIEEGLGNITTIVVAIDERAKASSGGPRMKSQSGETPRGASLGHDDNGR